MAAQCGAAVFQLSLLSNFMNSTRFYFGNYSQLLVSASISVFQTHFTAHCDSSPKQKPLWWKHPVNLKNNHPNIFSTISRFWASGTWKWYLSQNCFFFRFSRFLSDADSRRLWEVEGFVATESAGSDLQY